MNQPVQEFLSDEMKPVVDHEIETAAEDYRQKRDARMAALKKEVDAQNTLIHIMRTKELTHYEYDDTIVTLEVGKTKAKVKSKKDEDEESDED